MKAKEIGSAMVKFVLLWWCLYAIVLGLASLEVLLVP